METKVKSELNQKEIAEKLGVTQATVSNWLNLKSKPRGLTKAVLEAKLPELAERLEKEWKQ